MKLPRIQLISTGGTIAGWSSGHKSGYQAAVLTGEKLVEALPGLNNMANVCVQTLLQKDSKDMRPADWVAMADAVQSALAKEDVAGVVLTHGTDTLEETAYFLSHTVKAHKPVVLTAAMRPANALSPDGPQNLWDAIYTACTAPAIGVVVVVNGRVYAGHAIRKSHATDLYALGAEQTLARVERLGAQCVQAPVEVLPPQIWRHGLPPVAVIWVGAGSAPDMLQAYADFGYAGLILALPGNASIPKIWWGALECFHFQNRHIVIQCASRTGSGVNIQTDLPIGCESTQGLPPAQARVALMLRLAKNLFEM